MFGKKPKARDRSEIAPAAEPLISAGKPSAASQQAEGVRWQKLVLAFYTFMLLVTSVGNTVYFKRMTNAMPNYSWYLTMLSTVIYVPFFAVLAGTGLFASKQELVGKFFVMGVCDGLSGTLMVLGGVHTSGTLQVLLSQAVIPFTMLASVCMIGKRYHLLQQVGAAVIVLGIVFAKAGGGGSSDGDDSLVFNVLFLLAIVPSALSSVFKEVAFRGFDGDLDVNVLQFWVAMFQVVVNVLAMPIYTLKMLGDQTVPLDKMPSLTTGGTRCLFFLEDQVIMDCDLPGERPCDHCRDAWVPVAGYMAFNLFFNIFTMLVIKHGSATLSFLVSTLRMPLSSLAFSSALIMGKEAVPVGFSDYFSLGVILVGLGSYRVGARYLKQRQRSQEAAAPSSPLWPSPTDSVGSLVRRGTSAMWRLAPLFTTGPHPADPQPAFVLVRDPRPQPRTADRLRDDLYRRLGAASPMHSPRMRDRSPPGSPPSIGPYGEPQGFTSPQMRLPEAGEEEEDTHIAITGLPPTV